MSRQLGVVLERYDAAEERDWAYQFSSSSTVIDTCGLARRYPSRTRVSSMFKSTRPSSQSYQVAAVCGVPSDAPTR